MKRIMALTITTCIAFSNTIVTYGEITSNVSGWAEPSMRIAYNRNIIKEEAFGKATSYITRAEFSEILVALYCDVMKEDVVIDEDNPFTDITDIVLLQAVKLGFIEGISETEFKPNEYLTREEMTMYLVNLLEKFTIDLSKYAVDNPFPDVRELEKSVISDIDKLYGAKVISGFSDGNFYPARNVTTEEAVMACINTLWCFETTRNHQIIEAESSETSQFNVNEVFTLEQFRSLTIAEKNVYLGQTKEEILEVFGTPQRIDTTVYILDRYVYHDNYENYFFVTFVDNCVAEIFTTSNNFTYLDFKGENKRNNLLKYFNGTGDENHQIISDNSKAELYISYNDDVCGMLLQDEVFITGKYSELSTTLKEQSAVEPGFIDLIQSIRNEADVEILKEDRVLRNISLAHAIEMSRTDTVSSKSVDGRTAFDRMNSLGINFKIATEIVDIEYGDYIGIYKDIISSPANYSSVVNSKFEFLGVGLVQKNNYLYITLDMYGI